jgi:hypothetical protein
MKHTVEEGKAKIEEFKSLYKRGLLTPEQIQRLESIKGLTWEQPEPEPMPAFKDDEMAFGFRVGDLRKLSKR